MSDVRISAVLPLAKKALAEKWGYIWGATGQIHTQSDQDKATREQTVKWGQQWVGKRVLDCSGLFSWSYKQCGGYMYHGTNTMWNKYTVAKGTLTKGERSDGKPMKIGTAVFLTKGDDRHHVGIYIGDGWVIEAKGTYYGVVKSSVKVWHEWAELKGTIYDADGAEQKDEQNNVQPSASATDAVSVSLNVLSSGCRGDQVKTLQRLMNGMGYNSGSVDGVFGTKTETALKNYQKAKGLKTDGVCGADTWRKMLGANINV